MPLDFRFIVPESFHKKLVQIGTVVSEKISFEFLYVHYLWTRSRNDIDLQYAYTFIYSIRCLLILKVFLENTLFSLFPIEKLKLHNLTLP